MAGGLQNALEMENKIYQKLYCLSAKFKNVIFFTVCNVVELPHELRSKVNKS